MEYSKTLAALCLFALVLGPGCGERQGSPNNRDQTESSGENRSGTNPEPAGDPLEGFTEGSGVPDGWPADLIPLPAGAVPVASLGKSTVPGTSGEANTVFYSAEQSPQDIQSFWARELPAKGWQVIESSPPGDYLITAAEGNGYVGIFGTGVGFGPAEVSGKKIAIQIILAKMP